MMYKENWEETKEKFKNYWKHKKHWPSADVCDCQKTGD